MRNTSKRWLTSKRKLMLKEKKGRKNMLQLKQCGSAKKASVASCRNNKRNLPMKCGSLSFARVDLLKCLRWCHCPVKPRAMANERTNDNAACDDTLYRLGTCASNEKKSTNKFMTRCARSLIENFSTRSQSSSNKRRCGTFLPAYTSPVRMEERFHAHVHIQGKQTMVFHSLSLLL